MMIPQVQSRISKNTIHIYFSIIFVDSIIVNIFQRTRTIIIIAIGNEEKTEKFAECAAEDGGLDGK